MLRAGRLDDAIERDHALAATETALFGKPHGRTLEFGRYVLLERIGAGGQGIVHAAYDPELDRRVAIKLLGTRGHESRREDLLREAQAAARLSHPNVLAVHDVGVFERPLVNDNDAPTRGVYVVTELIEGETLQVWRTRHDRTLREVLDVLCSAGRGIAAAHASGLVHADVKPDNVLVGRDGRVRVLDFGLARAIGPPSAREPDPPRRIVGTPAYMAPEQHRASEALDPRADVFSFCVMLFEAVYGQRPFEGGDLESLLAAKYRREFRIPKTPRVPRWLTRVVLSGLSPIPEERPATMDALLAALQRDRPRRVRIAAGFAFAGLVIGLLVYGLVQARGARGASCENASRELAGVWDDNARNTIARAFTAADPEHAQDVWQRVERGLDVYASQWIALREATCWATVVEEREPVPVMAARVLCLDKRAARLGGLVRRLGEVDERSMTRAVQSVAELPPLEPCQRVTGEVGVVADAREHALALEAELADVDALRHSERFAEAEAASERALALAGADADPRSVVRVWLQRGGLERWRGDFFAAEAALVKALDLAERAGDDELAGSALIDLGFVDGVPLARPAEGLRLLDLADAKLARIGGDERLAAQLAYHRGRVLERLGRVEEAERALNDAFARAELAYGAFHPLVADIENMRGVTAERRGRHVESLAHYRRALQMRMDLVGEQNARTAIALGNSVVARWNLGDTRGALEDQRRAIATLERTLGPSHSDTSWARRTLAERLIELERVEEALDEASQALRAAEATLGPNHPDVAKSAVARASALRDLGRAEEALALDERAIAIASSHPESGYHLSAMVDRVATLRSSGACAAVVVDAAAVLAETAALDPEAVLAHLERARCSLAAGQDEFAALDLGLALVVAHARGDGVISILPLQRELARALARRSPAAARPIAAAALDVVRRTGVRPSWRAELEQLSRG